MIAILNRKPNPCVLDQILQMAVNWSDRQPRKGHIKLTDTNESPQVNWKKVKKFTGLGDFVLNESNKDLHSRLGMVPCRPIYCNMNLWILAVRHI